MAWCPYPDLEGGGPVTEQPIIEPIPSGYRCDFPDETSLEAIDVEQDRFGRLFVTLGAIPWWAAAAPGPLQSVGSGSAARLSSGSLKPEWPH